MKRTTEEWQALIEEYKASGLSQIAFCKQKNISPKSLRRYATPQPMPSAFVQVQPKSHAEHITLQLRAHKTSLQLSGKAQHIATMIKALVS